MTSKTPNVFRNSMRAASGGVVVIVAIIAMMFLRGGGFGSGDSDGDDNDARVDTSVDAPPAKDQSDESTSGENGDGGSATDAENVGGLTDDEKKALADDVLGIMIDEYDYFMVITGEDTIYRPTELERLLYVAQQAKGDSNGIKVRILRRETSRTKAEVDLKSALADVGVGDDAVYMPKDLLNE